MKNMKKRKRGKVEKDDTETEVTNHGVELEEKQADCKIVSPDDYRIRQFSVLDHDDANHNSSRASFEAGLEINRKRRCKSPDAQNMSSLMNSNNEGVDRVISQDVAVRLLPQRENAMLNELILINLMQFAPLKELARNRLVCRKWNLEASEFMKRQHLIEIVDDGTRRCIAAFVDSMRHSYMMPYRRFDILFNDRMPKKLPNSYRTFFFLYGGFINHLSIGFLLDCEVNFSVHTFRNVFLMSVPNLVSLAIDLPVMTTAEPSIFLREKRIQFHRLKSILIQDFVDDNEDTGEKSRARYSPGFMADLLKTAPALQKLSLFTESRMLMGRIVNSLETLKMNKSPLTQLHLDGTVTEADLNALTTYQFQLRAIRLRWLSADVTKKTLEKFLTAHKKSLENLCIGDRCEYGEVGEDNRRFHLQLPSMDKLNILKITRRSCYSDRHQGKFYLTTGLYQLPVLKKLIFDNDFPEPFPHVEDFFPKCDRKCLSLKELDFSCELLDHAIFHEIAKDCPEITILRLTQATTALLKVIFQCMVNVEALFLYLPVFGRGKGNNIGSLCIQLDVRNCKKICILRSPREGYWFTVVFKKPAVGVMKKIHTLEVETRNMRNSVHDVRVLTAFDELKTLYFNRKLTHKYRRALVNHLPKVKIVEGVL